MVDNRVYLSDTLENHQLKNTAIWQEEKIISVARREDLVTY